MLRLCAFFLRTLIKSGRSKLFRFDSVFMTAGIVISTAVLMTAFSLFSGYEDALKQAILGANSHLYVYRSGSADLDSCDVAQVGAFLQQQPETEAWGPAVTGQAVAVVGTRYRGVYIRGIDSEQPNPPTRYRQFVIKGSPDLRDPECAVVGEGLAKELGLALGDTVRLASPLGAKFTPLGFTPHERQFRVTGLYRSGMYEYDSHYFMTNPEVAGEFSAHPGQISLIEVRLRHPETAWEVAQRWQDQLNAQSTASDSVATEYELTTWIDHFGNLFSLIAIEKWLLFMVLSLLVLIASFNTAGAVMTSILEQRRQIGILKAVGMPNSVLRIVYLSRALLLSAFGVIAGECLGWVLGKVIEYQTIYQLKGDVYFIDRLHAHTDPLTWLLIFATAMVIVTVACLFPLRRITKLNVTDVLRGNL